MTAMFTCPHCGKTSETAWPMMTERQAGVLRLADGTRTKDEVARELGITPLQVYGTFNTLLNRGEKVSLKNPPNPPRSWSFEESLQVYIRHEFGRETYKVLAKEYKLTGSRLAEVAHKAARKVEKYNLYRLTDEEIRHEIVEDTEHHKKHYTNWRQSNIDRMYAELRRRKMGEPRQGYWLNYREPVYDDDGNVAGYRWKELWKGETKLAEVETRRAAGGW